MNQEKRESTPRIRRLQIVSLTLLLICGTINYLDRGSLSVANPLIRQDLGISLSQMGWLLSAFGWSYAIMQLPIGVLVDRLGPRITLGVGLTFWSLAQGIGGLCTNFTQFVWARIFLGIGEAPHYPTSARVVSNWFAPQDRGVPVGVFNAASPLGTALAPLLLTFLMLTFNWRWMFVTMGVLGLVAAVVWIRVYRDPEASGLSTEHQAYLAERPNGRVPEIALQKMTFAEWCGLFAHRTTWSMILGFFGSVYLNWVFITWLPGGCLVAGWFSDQLIRRGMPPIQSRKLPIVIGMVGMSLFTVPAALVQSNVVALACISMVVFLGFGASACSWALATAAAPPNRVASLGAVQNFGGYLGGALAPILTGSLAQSTHSFVPALLTGAVIAFVSAMIYLFGVRDPIS
jgi:MFS family permease